MILVKNSRKPIINISRRGIKAGKLYRDNTVDAFNIDLWAMEGLALLTENMVMGNLIHRNYSPMIARFGDTVNVRKPGEFEGIRKTNADSVTIQNATAVNIPVKLNQHIHVSYLIKDGEESIAFTSLVDEFLRPAMIAEARTIDRVLSAQVYQFLGNTAGRLTKMDTTNGKRYMLDARAEMNANNAPVAGRRMALTPPAESVLLDIENFTDASYLGDDGTALREASLGRKLGFDNVMAQNQPYVTVNNTGTVVGAVNNASGYAIGATSITVDGLSTAITAGTWLTIEGDNTPQQVVSTTGGGTPTAIVITPGLRGAVADNAVVRLYAVGAVSGTYTYDSTTDLGYAKEITVSGFSAAPQVGQMVTFGSSPIVYGIIKVNGSTGITLDRPIEATISNAATVNLGPYGGYNFGFNYDALTLVSRPLATPRQGTGALSGVTELNNLSMRVTITYDGNKQGHLVTIDLLMGVKVMEQAKGVVMFS